ncbi:uncharacterized protein LOC127265394 [Andrographis paniculata]|uniref:uncharacterized protein LOC127265394 n=1 Tax=Andrographis paniculata TaxID=175694 RepID=UPI0021E8CEC6|nr:uncharacterized protein LOC127265394 [Andrographis paniculata]
MKVYYRKFAGDSSIGIWFVRLSCGGKCDCSGCEIVIKHYLEYIISYGVRNMDNWPIKYQVKETSSFDEVWPLLIRQTLLPTEDQVIEVALGSEVDSKMTKVSGLLMENEQ